MEKAITIVLPYYNEREYIGDTIDSICRQSFGDFIFVLVDNGSTDGTSEVAKSFAWKHPDVAFTFLHEETPGKIHALMRGTADLSTKYVVTVDADTIYPVDYLRNCIELFENNPQASSVFAIDIYGERSSKEAKRRIQLTVFLTMVLQRKCHSGAYAQAFRTDKFKKCGGYDDSIWPFLIEDHEIVHRILPLGPTIYSERHHCFPSPRRIDRSGVSWSTFEKLIYAVTPSCMMDWYFYAFLAKRFDRRGMRSARLRERDW